MGNYIDIPGLSAATWREPVSTTGNLPTTGNSLGDARVVTGTSTAYIWTGSAWQQASGAGGPGFGIVQTPAGTAPTATVATDTLTLTSSDSSVTITGNSTTDTVDVKVGTLSNVLKLDGTTSPTANISWNSKNLTSLGSITYASDGVFSLGVWNGNRPLNGSFSGGLNVGSSPDRQDGGVIECGSATSHMIQFGTLNTMLPHTDGHSAFRDKAMGTSGQLYGIGKANGSAVLRFFKYDISSNSQTDTMTIDGATGNVRVTGNLGVGNSATGSTLGSVVKKLEIFDASGTSLGFIPIYNSIT